MRRSKNREKKLVILYVTSFAILLMIFLLKRNSLCREVTISRILFASDRICIMTGQVENRTNVEIISRKCLFGRVIVCGKIENGTIFSLVNFVG